MDVQDLERREIIMKQPLCLLSDLFEAKYGVNLELLRLDEGGYRDTDHLCFVSRTETNNGVSAIVHRLSDVAPISAGTLTVAASGSVLATFLQPYEYYSGRDLYYLTPKREMSERELIFYALCIRKNKYRFNYGRQANRTLRELMVPAHVPERFLEMPINFPSHAAVSKKKIDLHDRNWKWFRLDDLFDIKKGKRLTKEDMRPGTTPFIGSSELDNGVTAHVDVEPIHKGNTISVTYNGSVAEAFYQPQDFWASDDVNVLYPKFAMNPYIAMFLIAIIRKEKYRYNYGRKWHLDRMRESKIKLPVDAQGNPDWQFMEDYIKSLPYSKAITSSV